MASAIATEPQAAGSVGLDILDALVALDEPPSPSTAFDADEAPPQAAHGQPAKTSPTRPIDRPVTRSEQRAAIRRSPMSVSVEQRITVSTEVDIVAFFADFDERQRNLYWASGAASDLGFDDDWARPYAYLLHVCSQEAEVIEPLLAASFAISHIDEGVLEDRITARSGIIPAHDDKSWTEADYRVLTAVVPWLRPPTGFSDDDIARLPSESDVPLF